MKRFISVQILQAKTEHGKCILSHVRSKFIHKRHFSDTLLNTYVSCSTKHDESTWQSLTCHIENVFKQQKAFLLQIEARLNQKNDTNTAGCETGFSAQNQINNALRNRLKAERLDVLMTIDIEGPPSKDIDFSTTLDVWARTNRRIST